VTAGQAPPTERRQPAAGDPVRGLSREVVRLAGMVAGLALLVNAIAVDVPRAWRDEAATHMANQRTLPQLWSMLDHIDAVHGVYYLIVRLWQHGFGESILSLRMLSVLAVAVGAGLITLLAAELFGAAAAPWSGLCYALLPPLTWAAGEARSYALSAALVTAAMLAFWIAVRRQRLWWVWYALLAAAGIYVFVYSALAFAGVGLAMIWLPAHARLRALLATLGAATLSVPLVVRVAGQGDQVSWLADYHYGAEQLVADAFWGQVGWAAWLGVALSVLALGYAGRLLRERALRGPLACVLGWLLVPSAVLGTAGVFAAIYHPRYVTFSVPALALLLGLVASRLGGLRLIAGLLLTLACVPALIQSRGPQAKSTAAAAVAVLAEAGRPGDGLYIVRYDRHALPWSFPEAVAALDDVGADRGQAWRGETLKQPSRPVRSIGERLAAVNRVWVFADKGIRVEQTLRAFDRLGFRPTRTTTVEDGYEVTLILLERTG
jgi:mannosyltransferase